MGSSQSRRAKKFESRYLARLQNQHFDQDSILSLPNEPASSSQASRLSAVAARKSSRQWQHQPQQQQQQQQPSNYARRGLLRHSEWDLYHPSATASPSSISLLQSSSPSPLQPMRQQQQQQRQHQQLPFPSRQNYYDVPPCCRRKPTRLPLRQQQLQQQQQQQQQLQLAPNPRLKPKLKPKRRRQQQQQQQELQLQLQLQPFEQLTKHRPPNPYYISGSPQELTMDQVFLQDDLASNTNNTTNPSTITSSSLNALQSASSTTATIGNQQNHQHQHQQHQHHHLHQNHYEQMFHQPRYQQGLAYTYEQRKQNGLLGLLPPAIQDQDTQVRAVINFLDHCQDELGRYIYLRHLKDYNERLFYRTLTRNVEKLMPIVYTPTVGLGCQKFSEIYMRPRGLFVSLNELGMVEGVLANWHERDVRVIVVTDGERILGLGDLGANGMGISIGKLSLYTALAGIPPQNVLPITIDVGTNNQQLLQDPFYIGLRHQRIRDDRYEALIDELMKAVVERWGRSCLIQFEDFGNSTAFNLLKRYRDHYCTFNDDIQGTASVCLSGLISAAKLIGKRLRDCSFLFYGAGEANLGTANLLVMAMLEEGATKTEALKAIWLIDSKGLVVKSRTDLSSHKLTYAQEGPQVRDLEEIVGQVKPAAIIGASAQGGAFSESICRRMAEFNERPIIFALSNPTSKAECTADQAYQWTDGRCVFASGSPFEPVLFGGKTFITGQGNNAYIFPGVGLAAIAAHVHSIPEETFLVAARALSDQLTSGDTSVGLVYPKLSKIREVTLSVAIRVLEYFYAERLATYRPEPVDKLAFLRGLQYDGSYETS